MVNYVLSSNYRRDSEKFKELEDHVGFIVLFMQKMIEEELNGNEKSAQLSREVLSIFSTRLWMSLSPHFYTHEKSHFYQDLSDRMHVVSSHLRGFIWIVKKPTKEKEEAPKIFTKELKKTRKPITPRPKKNMEEFVL